MVDVSSGVADRNLAGDLALSTQVLIFGGMFVGFAIKVPMFPFHTWLPDAHTQAPTQGSVILAAVLLKLGTYGFIRVALARSEEHTSELQSLMRISYAVFCSKKQKKLHHQHEQYLKI